MGAKLDGCIVYIYDLSGQQLATASVTAHNMHTSTIDIEGDIEVSGLIQDNARYELLILTSPTPHTYSCTAEKRGSGITLKLFRGGKRELRSDTRYEIRGKIDVFAYLDGGKVFELYTPQEAALVNISRGGIRFKMKSNSLMKGDTVRIRFRLEQNEKVLTAHVVNNVDSTAGTAEYGCELV